MCGADSSASHIHLLPPIRDSPPSGLSWKPAFSLWPNMAPRPRRTEQAKSLRLACWNADGVRGRKLELEHFINQHGVDICLLSETFLNHCQAFLLSNYVCHRTVRPTAGGDTASLVRCGIVHHSVPIPGLIHLQATAIQVTMAGKPVKILAAYHSPSRPLIGADLSACFGGGNAGLGGRRPQRQTRGLELAAAHKTGETPAWLCRRVLLSDLWTRHPNYQPIQPLGYSRCLRHCDNQESHFPGVFDFVLCAKLRQPPGTHWRYVSLILSALAGSPWFQAH
jgi:hypothetical protein